MNRSIYRYILRYTLRAQLLLLALTALTFPVVYGTLEVPKRIINEALGNSGIPDTLFGMPLPFAEQPPAPFDYLLLLCFLYLALVLINGGLKYLLNVYRGVVGERMLRQLRFQLVHRLLRFPPQHFHEVSQGETIPIITAETEPLGGFIGEAFSLPMFQGGLLITYLFFIYNQDPLLGLAATALYPLQLYLIPKLQRRVNELGRQRVLAVRRLGDRLGDSIGGISEIQTLATAGYEQRQLLGRLEQIFAIRLQIYKRKYFIKFLNNFIAKITPFFFYAVGGYYVLQGELTLGALVASIAAYQDLESPWKELLKYYQTKEDIRIKYEQIIEQFHPPGMLDEHLQQSQPVCRYADDSPYRVERLRYNTQASGRRLEGIQLQFRLNETLAILGDSTSGAQELGLLLSRQLLPESGRLTLGGDDLGSLNAGSLARALGYQGQAHLFSGRLRDNLFYGLNRPPSLKDDVPGLDPEELEPLSEEPLEERCFELFAALGMEENLYNLGLSAPVAGTLKPEFHSRLLELRTELAARLAKQGLGHLVERFDAKRYTHNLSVAENLLFATESGGELTPQTLAANPLCRQALIAHHLYHPLLEIGRELNRFMLELFDQSGLDDELVERFSFIRPEEFDLYRQLAKRVERKEIGALSRRDKTALLQLSLQLTPARHRLGLITPTLQAQLIEARDTLARLCEQKGLQLHRYDTDGINPQQSVLDNILHGQLAHGEANARERVRALIDQLARELQCYRMILRMGLEADVGSYGKRVPTSSRPLVALLRTLLAEPQQLILNQATQLLAAEREREVIEQVLTLRQQQGHGLILITDRIELATRFSRVIHLVEGQVCFDGAGTDFSVQNVAGR